MPRGEGVKKLSDLFLKYQQNLKAPQGHVVVTFCEVVEDVLGFTIDKKQVKYSPYNQTISLTLPGALKTEIVLNKDELLIHLKGRLGSKNSPTNII